MKAKKKTVPPRLQKLADLSKLNHNEYQRSINAAHVRKLAASMKDKGFLPSFPITVLNGGTMKILDGHHRVEAAKIAKVPVYFVQIDEDLSMSAINSTQKGWTILDYLMSYVRQQIPEYIRFYNWMGRYGFAAPELSIISLLGSSKNFKLGTMRLRSERHIAKIAKMRDHIVSNTGIKSRARMIEMLHHFTLTPELDDDRLMAGFLNPNKAIKVARDSDGFLAAFEEAYNFKRREKAPVAFIVRESGRGRKAMALKKGRESRLS